jgi:hypothetical protein
MILLLLCSAVTFLMHELFGCNDLDIDPYPVVNYSCHRCHRLWTIILNCLNESSHVIFALLVISCLVVVVCCFLVLVILTVTVLIATSRCGRETSDVLFCSDFACVLRS